MKIYDTPPRFRPSTHRYPGHQAGAGLEEACYQYLQPRASSIHTDWVYLPIFWQNMLFAQRPLRGGCYRPDPQVQRMLSQQLRPQTRYFTITAADEGMYETVPENVTIFGAGGHGQIPLPLLSSPHPVPPPRERDLLASFLGNIETGGPVSWPGRPPHSSWDPNGAGARVRRKLRDAFLTSGDCYIHQGNGSKPAAWQEFRQLAARSRYGLAPRGYGKTSYRLYEVMQLGCVPVYIYDDPWLPYRDELDWDEFCILCHEDQLPELPAFLRSQTEADWQAKRAKIEALWERYFTFSGCAAQVARYVQSQAYEPRPLRPQIPHA